MNADIWAGIFIGQAVATFVIVGGYFIGRWSARRQRRDIEAIIKRGQDARLKP